MHFGFALTVKDNKMEIFMNKKSFTMADRRSSRFHISEIERIAFTMAEILLSLTIIGVVAAITLPSLTGNINERTWEAQRKAFYARISQAMALIGNVNGYGQYVGTYNANNNNSLGSVSVTVDTAAQAFITDGLSKVLKINNICDNEHFGDCGIPDQYTKMFGSTRVDFPKTIHEIRFNFAYNGNPQNYINTKAVAFETQNRESVIAYYNPFCVGHDVVNGNNFNSSRYFSPYFCTTYLFDLNGKKGPNKIGKDIWFMSTLYSDKLETVMFEPNKISKETTDNSYTAATTIQFCADHNARLATVEEGMVSAYTCGFSGFAFGYMKDTQTNETYALHGNTGVIFKYNGASASTHCLYRN